MSGTPIYHQFITTDGVNLAYTDEGSGRPLVMIHGWTFSSRFFDGVSSSLTKTHRVIRLDLRGHGRSEFPDHGYRMSRLSKDLDDLLVHLDLHDCVVVGWSLGAPIIWGYLEMFGTKRVTAAVYIDQTPRQYTDFDWPWSHSQCWDDVALATLKTTLTNDSVSQDQQQIESIMLRQPTEHERSLFLSEMKRCRPEVRGAVMEAHTRLDWRDVIPYLDLPALVCVAKQNVVFDWRGPAWVADHLPSATRVDFENSRHGLFLDQPEKFVEAVTTFSKKA